MRAMSEPLSEAHEPVDGAEDRACDTAVLEREQRLSQSVLWTIQRRYYGEWGVDAWRTNTVPHYVTNNPVLAHAYAAIALAYLRDRREPITILELGAGSGRFAHLFLQAFRRLHRASPVADVRVRYVLTDFTAANVDFWRSHEAFRPLVEEGLVDFAVFDAERDGEVRLLESGVTLSAGAPLVVIANYVFDTIAHDAFASSGGALQEGLVTIAAPSSGDPADPALLPQLHVEYAYRPAPLDYYGEPDLDAVLREHASRLEGSWLFPVAPIRCLRRLAELAGGRLLLISGDKGDLREDTLPSANAPAMAIHGSFSLSVNYHALGAWARARGGLALTAPHQHAHLGVMAIALGEHAANHAETRLAFDEAVGRAGPDEMFTLRRGVQALYGQLPIEALVALIRLCHDDPRVLRDCLSALWEHLGELSEPARRDLVELVDAVWANYFHLGEPRDLPFEMAMLLHGLEEHERALALFEASLRLYGDDPRTRWNMGLCHVRLGRAEEAARCFAAATAMGFTPVGALQAKPLPE
jgi:SAM-dependent methyltransferase